MQTKRLKGATHFCAKYYELVWRLFAARRYA